MHKVVDYRRENLRKYRDTAGGLQEFALKLGRSTSDISQLCGSAPTRDITDDRAREFEVSLKLAHGALDAPVEVPPGQYPAALNRVLARIRAAERTAKMSPVEAADATDNAIRRYMGSSVMASTAPSTEAQTIDRIVTGVQSNMGAKGSYHLSESDLGRILLAVGNAAEAMGVNLPPVKFASVAMMTVEDALEHGGEVDDGRLRKLLSLAK